MLDLSSTPDEFLEPIARVVEAALQHARSLRSDDVMVVGAWCRDIQHHALGHRFATSATRDPDLALALSSWDAYRALADAFPSVGDSGIRFRIAEITVDLLPFGDYAAAKLGAWLDRSEWFEAKNAADLALVLYWYGESDAVRERLYATSAGNAILIAESADVPLAAARILGVDVAGTIGSDRLAELLARWPGNIDMLNRELSVAGQSAWPRDGRRRGDLVDALSRGLHESGSGGAPDRREGDE